MLLLEIAPRYNRFLWCPCRGARMTVAQYSADIASATEPLVYANCQSVVGGSQTTPILATLAKPVFSRENTVGHLGCKFPASYEQFLSIRPMRCFDHVVNWLVELKGFDDAYIWPQYSRQSRIRQTITIGNAEKIWVALEPF